MKFDQGKFDKFIKICRHLYIYILFCFVCFFLGKVLVHCAMGLSRSSSLVLAYLMIHEDMTLVEAIKAVAQHRNICPNSGFLEQLRELDKKLHYQSTAL